jgi:hypothetical protein
MRPAGSQHLTISAGALRRGTTPFTRNAIFCNQSYCKLYWLLLPVHGSGWSFPMPAASSNDGEPFTVAGGAVIDLEFKM